ncbi:MAG: hypothetical protein EB072_18790, partial [Betaproteobacteria bacterium]|nr:hypothetical protein [Betaproteobacteria bacterium]
MLIKNRASESTHWYTRSGEPMYTVKANNGQQRNTTLRDARKQQILLAALTLPKAENESIDAYAERVLEDSKKQAQDARDLGTDIHAQVQGAFEGGPENDYSTSVKALLRHAYGEQDWVSEQSFCHPQGFGGKVDLHCKVAVIDIKTKAFGPNDDPQGYDEHLMQLSAYRSGLILPSAR